MSEKIVYKIALESLSNSALALLPTYKFLQIQSSDVNWKDMYIWDRGTQIIFGRYMPHMFSKVGSIEQIWSFENIAVS